MANIPAMVNPKETEMRKFVIAAGAVCFSAFMLSAQAYTGHELAKHAKITLKQARTIALKAFPGRITDEELEKEKGGSGLRYSFDIRRGKATREVGVDAVTGKVLENDPEEADSD
jgi:uncharacterized membrane protein YkoI